MQLVVVAPPSTFPLVCADSSPEAVRVCCLLLSEQGKGGESSEDEDFAPEEEGEAMEEDEDEEDEDEDGGDDEEGEEEGEEEEGEGGEGRAGEGDEEGGEEGEGDDEEDGVPLGSLLETQNASQQSRFSPGQGPESSGREEEGLDVVDEEEEEDEEEGGEGEDEAEEVGAGGSLTGKTGGAHGLAQQSGANGVGFEQTKKRRRKRQEAYNTEDPFIDDSELVLVCDRTSRPSREGRALLRGLVPMTSIHVSGARFVCYCGACRASITQQNLVSDTAALRLLSMTSLAGRIL